MRAVGFLAIAVAIGLGAALTGCSTDAPTQGHSVTPTQLSSDIDKELDALEQMPLQKRFMARPKLDIPIAKKGTAAQKARYADLMKGAPPAPIGAARIRPQSDGQAAKRLLPAQGGEGSP